MNFTLKEALKYSKDWKINEWFQEFLLWKWSNLKLANIIKDGWYLDELKLVKFDELKRMMWAEKEGLMWSENSQKWDKRINDIIELIKSWSDCPPLMVWYNNWAYTIADWSHRYEAMKRLWINEYWTSVWYENKEDFDKK